MKRREFLKASALGAAAFSASGLIKPFTRQSQAATVTYNLTAETISKTLVDGTTIAIWQFTGIGGPGSLGSGLVVLQGDTVIVNVLNNLDRAINFAIPGIIENTPTVAPGATMTYQFIANNSGSYFYCDTSQGELGHAMGLCGPLVVLPADGSNTLYPGGTLFDAQYTLVLQELDTRLNTAITTGLPYNMDNYEPNYFFVNGFSYPDTTTDPETAISMTVGQNIAVRIINPGLIYNPLHFHGYHVKVATRNRQIETQVIDKDTVSVAPHECVEILLPVAQAGVYPLHSHFLPAVTANGVYANGALMLMTAV